MWQRTIDCLGLAVRVRTTAPEVIDALTGVLRTYADAPAAGADVDYLLAAGAPPYVERDGRLLHAVELPIDLLPAFERDLYRELLARVRDVVLHAGAVVDARGRAVVIAGRSGDGKSTLVRGLLARGARYLSEEYVALVPGRRCRGLARALHVSDPAVAAPDGFACDDYPLRPHPPGTFRLFHPPAAQVWRGDAETAAVIAISHAADAPDALEPLGGGQGVLALWPAIFDQTPAVLDRLGPALAGVPLYRLHTRTPERAVALVEELRER